MSFTSEKTDQLLQEVYELIHNSNDLNSSRNELENRLKQVLDLNWSDDNIFNSYFEEFSSVIQAMHQMDFSKRLTESEDKTNFLNLIAQSINLVNQELEEKFLSLEMISLMIETLKVQNRIILISRDKKKVNYSFTNVKNPGFNVSALRDEYLESFIPSDHFSEIYDSDQYEYSGEVKHPLFKALPKEEFHFSFRNEPSYMVITITVFPENKFAEQLPRILSLISSLKSQFEDNPKITESLLGYSNALEIKSIYAELQAYMETERINLRVG